MLQVGAMRKEVNYRATLLLCIIFYPGFPPRVISQFGVTIIHLSVNDSLCDSVNFIRFQGLDNPKLVE